MENYLINPRKYNKILFKYMNFEGDVDYSKFKPDDSIIGFELLRWVMHKINNNPKEGMKMRVIVSMKDEETEVIIQEWYNALKPDGFVNIVKHKEVCELKKSETDKNLYKDAVLATSHRAVYNACVDFIIKTS
jgi:hypothetical protein